VAELRIEDVIRRPIITEKNTWLMEKSQFSFEVAITANKIQIKEAVEKTFGVTVLAVNTMVVKGQKRSRAASRRGGRIEGTEPSWKKAIVTLQAGDHIDLFEQV
jgi:large subunit ribosomal protein L23